MSEQRENSVDKKEIAGRVTPFYRLPEVFVKSGFPEVTYVERDDFIFLKLALEQPGRGVVIEGPSGIGKTTAIRKAVEDLNKFTSGSGLPIQRLLNARNPEDRQTLQNLREWHDGIVIVDDFHHLNLEIRHILVNYLKELNDTETKTKKLAIVGIPLTGQSLVDISPELATRLDVRTFGRVKNYLIQQMIEKGEVALNVHFEHKEEIIQAANGSLNLAQYLCFNLCAIAKIDQTQDHVQEVRYDMETAIELVLEDLKRKFAKSMRYFVAQGEARDITCLRLLEEIALAEEGILSLPLLRVSKPDFSHNIERFLKENWMDKLYKEHPETANHLFFDVVPQALIIDDPQLAFYLKQIRFSTLARDAGKIAVQVQRKIFVSYSHKDSKEWLERLHTHLKPIEREGIIDLWDDTKIAAGLQWKKAIMNALETARAAVLLVSANFLASDFIAEHELPELLARAEAGGTKIIPIIISPSLFPETKLGNFKAINDPDVPMVAMSYTDQEKTFVKVAQTIIEQFRTE